MGYRTRYLVQVVLEQAAFAASPAWVPAVLISLCSSFGSSANGVVAVAYDDGIRPRSAWC